MIDVDRLNDTITELEQQSEKMKTVSEYYEELMKISDEVAATLSSQTDINKRIGGTIEQLTNLKEENKQLTLGFKTCNDKITKDVKNLEDEVLKNVQALSSENNKLYSEFQQFLNSKLELFKSDVQLEIRGTANRLQNSMENDLKKIEEQVKTDSYEKRLALDKIQNTIMSSFEIQSKKNKINMVIMVGVFIVSIISLVLNLR